MNIDEICDNLKKTKKMPSILKKMKSVKESESIKNIASTIIEQTYLESVKNSVISNQDLEIQEIVQTGMSGRPTTFIWISRKSTSNQKSIPKKRMLQILERSFHF